MSLLRLWTIIKKPVEILWFFGRTGELGVLVCVFAEDKTLLSRVDDDKIIGIILPESKKQRNDWI